MKTAIHVTCVPGVDVNTNTTVLQYLLENTTLCAVKKNVNCVLKLRAIEQTPSLYSPPHPITYQSVIFSYQISEYYSVKKKNPSV